MLVDVLREWGGTEVSPIEVYQDIFKLGENHIQKENEEPGQYKANPIAYWKNADEEKGHFRIMFEDTFEETLEELQEADFAILNGLSYFGRRNVQEHASKMYAMIFDIDGVTDKTLNAFLSGAVRANAYPVPNYIVLSGHGVHLYYVFEEPIPLFPNIKLQLKELKYALIEKMWNMYTSIEEKKQFQGINQGFRVIGGKTKTGSAEPVVRAYRINSHPFSLGQLNEYVQAHNRIDETKLFKESKMTLEQAKARYPKWYEKVVVNKDRTPEKWDISGKVNGPNPFALYDWWIENIKTGATFRHRYFNVMCLSIYAAKCDVPFEKLEKDAVELIPFLNEINPEEPFTREDVDSALECYDLRYCTFPIRDIEKLSGIAIKKNKRNGLKQKQHLFLARRRKEDMKVIDIPMKAPEGRPKGSSKAREVVKEWRKLHPEGKKSECHRDTKLDPKTIRKWWEEYEMEKAMNMVRNRTDVETLSADESALNAQMIVKVVEKIANERGISEEEAYEVLLYGKTKKEMLREQAEEIIFKESEVDFELLDALAQNNVRSINIVPDDEYEEIIAEGFVDWLIKNNK